MKILKNNYKSKLVICKNCKSVLLLEKDDELLSDKNVTFHIIKTCPCCNEHNIEVRVIEID